MHVLVPRIVPTLGAGREYENLWVATTGASPSTIGDSWKGPLVLPAFHVPDRTPVAPSHVPSKAPVVLPSDVSVIDSAPDVDSLPASAMSIPARS